MLPEDRIPEHGPWTATLSPHGRLMLSSDDFHHDAQATVTGDFGSSEARLAYGRHLADILTRGASRARARNELADEGELLRRLERAAHGADAELLWQAADEVARLRVALAEAHQALERLQAHRYLTRKTEEAQLPSAFAAALETALAKR